MRAPDTARGEQRRGARGTRGRARTRAVRPEEVLPFGPTPVPVGHFAAIFEKGLRLALDEDPDAAPEIARARATALTWRRATGVPFEQAERARCEIYAAVLAERRLVPLRAGIEAEAEPEDVEETTNDEVQVPRGRPLPGHKVRRGGKR